MVEPNTVDLRENPFAQQALQFAAKNKPVDQAKLGADVQKAAKTDSAPSAQAQTQTVPLASLNQLLSKFDVQRIPISRLRLMRRDPMIAFALFFIQAQLLRARWSIKCPDAQVAAFVDNALREIWPSLVMNYMNKLTFGWQAAVKRFALTNPDWTYIDSNNPNATESPVWDNGTIQAVTWKPFVPLPPEGAEPNWDDNGDFNGIKYNPGLVQTSGGSPATRSTTTCSTRCGSRTSASPSTDALLETNLYSPRTATSRSESLIQIPICLSATRRIRTPLGAADRTSLGSRSRWHRGLTAASC